MNTMEYISVLGWVDGRGKLGYVFFLSFALLFSCFFFSFWNQME